MAYPLAALALVILLALPVASHAAQAAIRPAWSELSTAQRSVLSALEPQWNGFSAEQRKRWVVLADRYPKLSAAEQKRVQDRMQDWAKLTPQQREAARARYRALSKMTPEQRSAIIKQWTETQEAQQAPPSRPRRPKLRRRKLRPRPRPQRAIVPPRHPSAAAAALSNISVPPQFVRLRVRLVALVYEGVILAAVLFLATGAFTILLGDSSRQPLHALLQLFLFVVGGCYFVGSWTGGRRTLPMRTWRMHLVDTAGKPLDWRRAAVRYAAAAFGLALAGIGIAWVLFDPERQFLHDRIAGTRLVADAPVTKQT